MAKKKPINIVPLKTQTEQILVQALRQIKFAAVSMIARLPMGNPKDAPVIADLDTGYGNAVNVAYLMPRYAAAGVAAVVIEDKTFPKDSSLRPDGRQILVAVEEFQGKIEAARLSPVARWWWRGPRR